VNTLAVNFRESIIPHDASIHRAIQTIDSSAAKIALVADADDRLLGTVTDGDVRRGILRGISVESAASIIMNMQPRTIPPTHDRAALLAAMRRDGLRHLPIVDERGRLVGLATLAELLQLTTKENWVVLMVGGRGSRLFPLTEDLPKSLLSVGPKPILEMIVDGFISIGCTTFFLAVNYLAERVMEYFGDGSSRGVNIVYLREREPLGTAGALGLLPQRPSAPFFVMNGDIVTNIDFRQLLEFHEEHRATGTMCVREDVFQVPYGVVDIEGHRVRDIREKPVLRNFINAGIYVFDPDVLKYVPAQGPSDIPDLFKRLLEAHRECVAFPLREYWVDIGRPDDYRRAQIDFENGIR
jgi:dTDP-glucose pyrophosphorylase